MRGMKKSKLVCICLRDTLKAKTDLRSYTGNRLVETKFRIHQQKGAIRSSIFTIGKIMDNKNHLFPLIKCLQKNVFWSNQVKFPKKILREKVFLYVSMRRIKRISECVYCRYCRNEKGRC